MRPRCGVCARRETRGRSTRPRDSHMRCGGPRASLESNLSLVSLLSRLMSGRGRTGVRSRSRPRRASGSESESARTLTSVSPTRLASRDDEERTGDSRVAEYREIKSTSCERIAASRHVPRASSGQRGAAEHRTIGRELQFREFGSRIRYRIGRGSCDGMASSMSIHGTRRSP